MKNLSFGLDDRGGIDEEIRLRQMTGLDQVIVDETIKLEQMIELNGKQKTRPG